MGGSHGLARMRTHGVRIERSVLEHHFTLSVTALSFCQSRPYFHKTAHMAVTVLLRTIHADSIPQDHVRMFGT